MPKSIIVDPSHVRREEILKSREIPLNRYNTDPKKELARYGKKTLNRVFFDMFTIREFETSLNEIKTQGTYRGIEYNHRGPAHLSLGQEASAVGQSLVLGVDDFIFGSHRSHGEIIAKCLSAINQLDDEKLMSVMKNYMGGSILRVVESGHDGTVKDLAVDYILYGMLAEIFAREFGFNRGWGGSMHAFFAPFGSMPNNAIVGGSSDIATGSALYKRINRKPGIVIANIGDASSACGPTWEAMMLASMEQYRSLWDGDIGGAPPIIFNIFNNFYGMGGQTSGETMGFKVLARIGAGVNEEAMHAERVDGYDPLALADATSRKKTILEEGRGPVLLDVITYRLSGHSPSDASSYRTKEEIALWQEQDCIAGYEKYLLENELSTQAKQKKVRKDVVERIKRAMERAVSMELSPRLPINSEAIGEFFSVCKELSGIGACVQRQLCRCLQ